MHPLNIQYRSWGQFRLKPSFLELFEIRKHLFVAGKIFFKKKHSIILSHFSHFSCLAVKENGS